MEQKILTICICSLVSRQHLLQRLLSVLNNQITSGGFQDKIEILTETDNGEKTIGNKRNILLARSSGRFVCFIDDDDLVSDEYCSEIISAIENHPDIDCVGITGWYFCDQAQVGRFICTMHKIHRKIRRTYFHCRKPNHLTPLRRDIAIQVKYPELYCREDEEYAMEMSARQLVKSEHTIEKEIYHYMQDPSISTSSKHRGQRA